MMIWLDSCLNGGGGGCDDALAGCFSIHDLGVLLKLGSFEILVLYDSLYGRHSQRLVVLRGVILMCHRSSSIEPIRC